ncbi:MAG: MFS transporter [Candidatus Korobacteraceae bacterium]
MKTPPEQASHDGGGSPLSAQSITQRYASVPPLPIHIRWVMVIGIGCFLDAFTSLIVSAALPVLIPTLHIGYGKIGMLISAAFFGMFFGALMGGALSERFGRRTVFACSIIMFGILSICCGFAWDYNSLVWLRVLQGIGLGSAIPVAAALAAECLPAKIRGKAYSLTYGLLFALGFVVAPLVGIVLIQMLGPNMSWRVMFGVAGLALPYGIASFWLLPESPRWLAVHGHLGEAEMLVAKLELQARKLNRPLLALAAAPVGKHQALRFSEAFGSEYFSRTILIWTIFLTTFFVQYGLTAWLPSLYVRIGGLPPSKALGLTVATSCLQVLAAIVFAFTVDRVGRKAWITTGFGLMIIGVLLGIVALSVFHVSAWPVLFAAAVPLTAGVSVNSCVIYLYAPELFPTRMRAWTTSTGSAAGRIGSIIAPIAIGAILQAKLGLVSVFVLLGMLGLVGLIVVVALGVETKLRTLEELSH